MSLATLIGSKQGTKFSRDTTTILQVAVTLSEKHKFSAQISTSPVESGSFVNDHRRVEPFEISIEGCMAGAATNPIEYLEQQQNPSGNVNSLSAFGDAASKVANNGNTRVQEAYQKLIEMYNANDVFDVVTGLKTYSNMLCKDLTINRDKNTDQIVSFSANFVEIKFATAKVVAVKAIAPASPTKDAGPKPTKVVPPPVKPSDVNQSILDKVTDLVTGGGK